MARLLLLQYAYKKNNNLNNNPCNKKGDKNRKKSDDAKSEDKGNNNTGTVCAHVREASLDKDKTGASIDGQSIDIQVSDLTKTIIISTQCVEDTLVTYLVDNPIWDCADFCGILIDTVNSVEAMKDAHVADQEYYNQRDKQYSFCNSNAEFKNLELELAPDIIKEDKLYELMDQYDK